MQYHRVMIEMVFVDQKVSIKLLDDRIQSGADARFHSVQTGVYCGESSVDVVESSVHGRKAAVRPALEFCEAAVHPPLQFGETAVHPSLQRREAAVHSLLETIDGHASAADHSIVELRR